MPRKKHETILKYVCTVGDPQPIVDGKRPLCAMCASKKTQGVIEITQYGMFEDKVTTVRRCALCNELTSYTYLITFDVVEDVT